MEKSNASKPRSARGGVRAQVNVPVQIRIPPALRKRIDKIAIENRLTRNFVYGNLLEFALANSPLLDVLNKTAAKEKE